MRPRPMLIAAGETLAAFLKDSLDADEALARLPSIDPLHPCSALVELLRQALLECASHAEDRHREGLTVAQDLLRDGQLPDTSVLEWFKPQPWWALAHRLWLRRIPQSSYTLLIYSGRDPDRLARSFLRTARYRLVVVESVRHAIQAVHDERPEVFVTDQAFDAQILEALKASGTALSAGGP